MKFLSPRCAGFTIVELIIVIVITGIIGAMVAVFIRSPVQAYVDNVARAELSDVADTALRRVTRDLRLALPNSVRISAAGDYLEMLLTKTGGRYLAEEDEQGLAGVLNFDATNPSPNPLQFTIVGTPPAGRQAIVAGDSIVVYNLGPGFAPADAYACAPGVPCNRAVVGGIAGNVVTMLANPFSAQVPSMPSPTRRFQVVSTPVTYFCDAATGSLRRYSGYAIQAAQPVAFAAPPLSTAPSQAVLADRVLASPARCFTMAGLANVQRGLVTLTLTLGNAAEAVTLSQQIHVDNAP